MFLELSAPSFFTGVVLPFRDPTERAELSGRWLEETEEERLPGHDRHSLGGQCTRSGEALGELHGEYPPDARFPFDSDRRETRSLVRAFDTAEVSEVDVLGKLEVTVPTFNGMLGAVGAVGRGTEEGGRSDLATPS